MTTIPVMTTIRDTYRFTFGQFGKIVGLIWLPAVLMAVSSFFLKLPYLRFVANNPGQEDLILQHGPLVLGLYASGLLEVVLYAVMVTAVTREALHPTGKNTYLGFPLGRTTVRLIGGYFGFLGVIVFFLLAAALLLSALRLLPGGNTVRIATQTMLLLCIPAAIYLVARLSFLIAPSAVEGKGFGIEHSWRLTKGNVWRIVVLALATGLPLALIYLAGQVAIIGPDIFVKPFALAATDPQAMEKFNVEFQRLQADKFPLLTGLEFLLTPLTLGMTSAASALAYRALAAAEK
jgi:hypothetical protein